MQPLDFADKFFGPLMGEIRNHRLRRLTVESNEIERPFFLQIAADCRVRLESHGLNSCGEPVIAPGKALVHALLHHRPGAVESKKETVMIKLETILDCVVIDFGREPAQVYESVGAASRGYFSPAVTISWAIIR